MRWEAPLHSPTSTAERCRFERVSTQAPLSVHEFVATRLYTGPMFLKYNAVLRGCDTNVPALAERFRALCRGNRYASSIHCINSAIVKLSQLQSAITVYRGVGGVLPNSFLAPNQFNVRGGVERAFMSTTTDRRVALDYASSSGGASVVFAIEQVTAIGCRWSLIATDYPWLPLAATDEPSMERRHRHRCAGPRRPRRRRLLALAGNCLMVALHYRLPLDCLLIASRLPLDCIISNASCDSTRTSPRSSGERSPASRCAGPARH